MTQISRRQAITRGASTAAAVGAVVALSASARRAHAGPAEDQADIKLLQGIYSAEVDAIATYDAGAKILQADNTSLGPVALKVATHFRAQHLEHRDAIKAFITEKGGTVVEPENPPSLPPGFKIATAIAIDVVKLAADKEKAAAIAYAGALKSLNDEVAAELLSSIGGVETQHFVVLYLLAKQLISVEPGLTDDQIKSVVPRSFLVDIRGAGDNSLEKFADIPFEAAAT